MDTRKLRARMLGTALLTASFAVLTPAAQMEAHAQTADAQSLSEERLTTYATLHRAINQARDDLQANTARVHDREARERVRHEMDQRLQGLYTAHGMPKEEYDGITFLVSIDDSVRTRVEAILAGLNVSNER